MCREKCLLLIMAAHQNVKDYHHTLIQTEQMYSFHLNEIKFIFFTTTAVVLINAHFKNK